MSPADIVAANEADYANVKNLYEAVMKSKINPKIFYVGSANVYGNVPQEKQPIKESEEIRPLNHYAVSKASADFLSYRYFCEGLHIVRARPFNHTGPGQSEKFVCPRLAKQVVSIKREDANYLQAGNIDTSGILPMFATW